MSKQPRRLTSIEGFLVSIFQNNKKLEWSHYGKPVFEYRGALFSDEIMYIDLRDYPTLFERLPDETYRATAAARDKYLKLPRPL